MRKIMTILAVLMLLAGCGQGKDVEDDGGNGMKNPLVPYDTLEDINKKVGGNLVKPGVMGVDNELFYVISDKVAEYRFEINGNKCCFRYAKVKDEDISGFYIGGKTAFPSEDVEENIEYAIDGDTRLARWFDAKGQYVFTYTAAEMDDDTFRNIAKELSSLTIVE